MPSETPFLTTDKAFRDFCEQLPPNVPLALDTEFDWTKTYTPNFALLQVALDRTHAALVDPIALSDLTPFAPILADTARRKIFFSASNDLPLLVDACGAIPQNVFDVQTAVGFCGETGNQSLKAVVKEHLGIDLAKTETRSDWTKRPLDPQQLRYAADDVVLLPELAEELSQKLAANGNLAWFEEEMNERHCRLEVYALPDPNDAWRRMSSLRKERNPLIRRRVIALAIWRERTAQDQNLSRRRILTDEQLYWCANEAPKTEQAFLRMPECWPKRVRKYAETVLEIIANPPAEPPEAAATPSTTAPCFPREKLSALADRVLGIARRAATERGIDPGIVLSRNTAETYALNLLLKRPDRSKLSHGWRNELLKEQLVVLSS